jgi:exopolysaccharide biosynthesis protein
VVHSLSIDLQSEGLEFLVTPPSTETGILCTRTTSQFVREFGVHIAINGDGYTYLDPATTPPGICAAGDPVKTNGYAVSRRKVYSPRKTADPIIYMNQRNQITINEQKGQLVNAISGDRLIVEKGKMVKNLAAQVPQPRTALGLNRISRYLLLTVVDGRLEGVSEGMTFPELADLMISLGAYTAVNMDGGGSSTMVIRGFDGQPRVINTPVDSNIPGKERAVGNHLGIFHRKP